METYVFPTLRDILYAKRVLSKFLRSTPLVNWEALDEVTGFEGYLKLENTLPTGSFKVRGSIYLLSKLSEEERKRGVIVASTGNFALGISYASKLYDIKATVIMPKGSNPQKVKASQNLGAEVVFYGDKFDDARAYAEKVAKEKGYRYVHSANEPFLIAGVGTYSLEILEEIPNIDAIIVPVGGGSGVSGTLITSKSIDKRIRVIGVQSESSPAAYLSWKSGKIRKANNETYAEGLATGEGFELPQQIMKKFLDDFVLVKDDEILDATRITFNNTHILPESASASTLAASLKLKEELKGRKVALVITGGNTSKEEIEKILST